MRIDLRGLSIAVCATALFFGGCHKSTPIATNTPPPPEPVKLPPPPPRETPPQAARITMFTAEPSSIDRGQSATLRWSVANATDMSIDQNLGAIQANGTRQVFPAN